MPQHLVASMWRYGPRPLTRGGPKRQGNYPEGFDHPVAPNHLDCDGRYIYRSYSAGQNQTKHPQINQNAACVQSKRDCKSSTQGPTTQLSCDSAIGLHLLSIRSSIYVLEAIFIRTSNSILYRQKEFVYNFTLLSHYSFVLKFPASLYLTL